MIIIGIVPLLSKEPKNLNPFLKPAIKQLQCLWKGIKLSSTLSRFPSTFSAAIQVTEVALDVSHFLAVLGKSKDYSGFDKETWDKTICSMNKRLHKIVKTNGKLTKY
jgi:hypothetical protein